MADPLKIGVEVNVGDLSKLAEGAQQVAASTRIMAQQFASTSTTAKDLGGAAEALAAKVFSSSGAVQQQTVYLQGLKSALESAKAAVTASSEAMTENGVVIGGTAEFLQLYQAEQQKVAVLTLQVAAAEKVLKSALAESFAAAQTATAMAVVQAEADIRAAAAKEALAVAAADAAAEQSAANEGMVASEVEVATQQAAVANTAVVATASQVQNAVVTQAATAANAAAIAPLVAKAQAYLQQGMTVQQTTAKLIGLGNAAPVVAQAVAQAGNAAGAATPPIQRFGAAAANAGNQAVGSAVQVDAMTRALASGAVRIAASEAGLGQLGFSLARVGAASGVLAPILAAAFPIFGVVALIQIVSTAITTMQEWANEAEKSAEEAAKWDREILKSADAVDHMQERLAGLAGPLAEDAETLSHMSGKVLDMSASMTELNKRLADGPGLWKSIKETVGTGLTEAFHLFDSAASDSERDLEEFNLRLSDSVKTYADLPNAIDEIRTKMRALREEQSNVNLASGASEQEKEYDRQYELLNNSLTVAKNLQQAHADEILAIQEAMDLKLASEEERAAQARIALHEAEAHELSSLHVVTPQADMEARLRLSQQQTQAELTEINKRESIEREAQSRSPDADFSKQAQLFAAERSRIVTEGKRREFEIISGTNEQIISSETATAKAVIQANADVELSWMRFTEARDKASFHSAETIPAVEAASGQLAKDVADQYERQVKLKQDLAEATVGQVAQEHALTGSAFEKPTADFGTDAYRDQLKAIQTIKPEILKELLDLNAQAMEIRMRGAQAEVEVVQQNDEKVEAITISNARKAGEEELRTVEDSLKRLQSMRDRASTGHTGMFAQVIGAEQARAELPQVQGMIQQISAAMDTTRANLMGATDPKVAQAYNDELQKQQLLLDRLNEQYIRLQRQSHDTWQQLGSSMEQAATAGFDAFNSGFIKMITGGMSFAHVMQRAWTSMAESFIVAVLKMGEKWVVEHVIMAAAQKTMAALGISTQQTSNAAAIAADKALGLSKAGIAGAGGVASMAAAPFPLDLTAPEFGAAMAASAASFLAFERGGIVPANLHEGEMVLPKHISTFVQTAAATASGKSVPGMAMPGSSPGRPIHFHFSPTVSSLNSDGINDVLSAHGDRMFSFMKSKLRRMGMNIA